jgi:hypothetical protein
VDILSSNAGKDKAQNLHLLQRISDLEGEVKKKGVLSPHEVLRRIRGLESRETCLVSDLGHIQLSVYDPLGELNVLHEQVAALRSMTKVGSGVERHGMTFSHPSDIAPVLRVIHWDISRCSIPSSLNWSYDIVSQDDVVHDEGAMRS